ncbi:DUF3679 domain-containing protein [Thalassobacillus hwangdonensis]|uniref:DUF3679 domain-containing protein n=1 Tax=Thalassobacillus hwangdonensis TaxID=546108 RepID=A0ABW3KY54_9BACI
MIRYIAFILFMMVLFLGGALFGINQASEGVIQTRGYTSDSLQDALEIKQQDSDAYEVTVMGVPLEQEGLEEKMTQYKDQATHSSVKVAQVLEKGVNTVYNVVIDSMAALVEPLF